MTQVIKAASPRLPTPKGQVSPVAPIHLHMYIPCGITGLASCVGNTFITKVMTYRVTGHAYDRL